MDTPATGQIRSDGPAIREVRIDCDRCGKPIALATSLYKRQWWLGGRPDGGITPEGQLCGGAYSGTGTRWRSRIWDVSPDGHRTWETREGGSRHKLVCNRQHRNRRGQARLAQHTITQEALSRACDAAIATCGRPGPDDVGMHLVLGVMWSGYRRAWITLADLR